MSGKRDYDEDGPILRVIRMPELFHEICRFLDKASLGRLVSMSRYTHGCVLPLLWEEIEFESILLTIPGVSCELMEHGSHEHFVYNPPDVIDMTRFEIYAPLVKILHTTNMYIVKPSQGLPALPNPLLPNLRRWRTFESNRYTLEDKKWICGLLTPSLSEFRTEAQYHCNPKREPESPWIDSVDFCSEFLNRMSETCVSLSTLKICLPDGRSSSGYPAVYRSIASMTPLRSLALSGRNILESLPIIGQLPLLETFSLYDYQYPIPYRDVIVPSLLPENSFPSLRHLLLERLGFGIFSSASEYRMPSRNLLTLSFKHHHRAGTEFTQAWCRTHNLSEMPQLRCLNAHEVHPFPENRIIIGLPLGQDITGWPRFLRLMPNLEELRLVDQHLPIGVLPLLASMLPKLSFLKFKSTSLDKIEIPDYFTRASQPISICVNAYFAYHPQPPSSAHGISYAMIRLLVPEDEIISTAARDLHKLWPNVTCETFPLQKPPHRGTFDEDVPLKMNTTIEELKEEAKEY